MVATSTCSKRLIAILVLIPPKITVACFPSIDSTLPTVVKPFIRTESPAITSPPPCCLRTAFFNASAAACCLLAFSFRCCSWRSLRLLILSTFFWKSSSESSPLLLSFFLLDVSLLSFFPASVNPAS